MPGSPYTSYIGIVFLALVIVGMGISGWKTSPEFWHKTDFLVVVIGIPVIAALLAIGWRVVKAKVISNTNNQLGAHWSDDGLTYPDADDELKESENV